MNSRIGLALLLSLTLGLAPFFPEPHIIKQLRNLATGQLSTALDAFDLVLHGGPWAYLVFTLVTHFRQRRPDKR